MSAYDDDSERLSEADDWMYEPHHTDETSDASELRPCSQNGCKIPATFRMTWPGQDESEVCVVHAYQARAVSQAMGFEVQLIPLRKEQRDGK